MNAPPPGWNPDPTGRHEYRYWDGSGWTDDVSDNGVTSTDPVAGGGPAGGEPTAAMEPTQSYDQWTTPPGGPGPSAPGPGAGAPGYGAPPPYPAGPDPYATGGGYPGQPAKGGSPKGFLIGAAVIAALGIIALVVFLVSGDDGDDGDDTATEETTTTESTDDTTDDTSATTGTTSPPDPTDADVFSLAVGDCLVDETTGTEVQQVPVVPCDQPHTQEVFYLHQIDAGDLPDDSEMQTIVGESCVVEFESFVGVPYEESALDITWLEPTPESWDAGDREVVCMVIDPAGEVTGSLQGANR